MTSAGLFVLVKWMDEEAWDVLPLKNSVGEVRNIDDVVGTVVDFFWKKGEESAPCTVLHYGTQKEMERKISDSMAIGEKTSATRDSPRGVGQRTIRRPARLEDDDSEVPMELDETEKQPKIKKKVKKTSSAVSHSILAQLDEVQKTKPKKKNTTPSCRCEKFMALKAKYLAVKQEKHNLTAQVEELLQYKELHSVVTKLKKVTATLVNTTTAEELDTSTPPPKIQGSHRRPALDVPSSPPVNQQPADIRPMSKIDIGNGVLVEKGRLLAVTQASSTATKLARNLFMVLFKREEVVGRSLTGKKSNAHLTTSELKEQLDPAKANAIIDFTVRKYPGSSTTLIRQSLANKVKELNKIKM